MRDVVAKIDRGNFVGPARPCDAHLPEARMEVDTTITSAANSADRQLTPSPNYEAIMAGEGDAEQGDTGRAGIIAHVDANTTVTGAATSANCEMEADTTVTRVCIGWWYAFLVLAAAFATQMVPMARTEYEVLADLTVPMAKPAADDGIWYEDAECEVEVSLKSGTRLVEFHVCEVETTETSDEIAVGCDFDTQYIRAEVLACTPLDG